jgi:hypothetical protein
VQSLIGKIVWLMANLCARPLLPILELPRIGVTLWWLVNRMVPSCCRLLTIWFPESIEWLVVTTGLLMSGFTNPYRPRRHGLGFHPEAGPPPWIIVSSVPLTQNETRLGDCRSFASRLDLILLYQRFDQVIELMRFLLDQM